MAATVLRKQLEAADEEAGHWQTRAAAKHPKRCEETRNEIVKKWVQTRDPIVSSPHRIRRRLTPTFENGIAPIRIAIASIREIQLHRDWRLFPEHCPRQCFNIQVLKDLSLNPETKVYNLTDIEVPDSPPNTSKSSKTV
jgi:hypothetical protein